MSKQSKRVPVRTMMGTLSLSLALATAPMAWAAPSELAEEPAAGATVGSAGEQTLEQDSEQPPQTSPGQGSSAAEESADTQAGAASSLQDSAALAAEGTDLSPEGTVSADEASLRTVTRAGSFASVSDGLYIIENDKSGKALEVSHGSVLDGGNVQQYAENNTPAQRFRLTTVGDGLFTLQNVNSGKVLDVQWGQARSGANVQQYADNGTVAQQWRLMQLPNSDSYAIVSALSNFDAGEYLVLDIAAGQTTDGANVQLYEYNETPAQGFTLHAVGRTVEDGVYSVSTALGGSGVLDIAGGSFDNSGNVQLYRSNDTLAQKFLVRYDDDSGYYTMQSAASAKLLDIAGGSEAAGANVQQYEENGTLAQKWTIEQDGARYRVRSGLSGKALDVAGGNSSDGANVQVWDANGTPAQQWSFEPTQLLGEGAYTVHNALGTVLDAAGGGTYIGANIQAYESNGTLAQKYYFYQVEGDVYRIEAMKSGLAVGVNGGNVELSSYVGADTQLWRAVPGGNGMLSLQSVATGDVLDVAAGNAGNGANVQTYEANGTPAQRWSLEETAAVEQGVYQISTALNSGKVVDVANGSTENGARLQVYESNGTAAQLFRVEDAGAGEVDIVALGSGKLFDVLDSQLSADDGSGVLQLWPRNGATAQRWRITYAGGGACTIESALGGSSLDVQYGQASNGTPLGLYESNGTPAQQFHFIESGAAVAVPYDITLDQMLRYQRGNAYLSGVSDEELRAALDPDESQGSSYYQFMDLRSGTGLTGSQLDAFIATNGSDGVLAGRGADFVAAADEYGLNEAYLTAHTVIESGWGTSRLARGAYYDGTGFWYIGNDGNQYWDEFPGYEPGTYYNLFGIGAVDSDPHKGGVETAIKNGWNSVPNAIRGAAAWISEYYVYSSSYPQVTLYEMKWDVARSAATHAYGWHQYATAITWAKSIAEVMGDCYTAAGVDPSGAVYRVPQYA